MRDKTGWEGHCQEGYKDGRGSRLPTTKYPNALTLPSLPPRAPKSQNATHTFLPPCPSLKKLICCGWPHQLKKKKIYCCPCRSIWEIMSVYDQVEYILIPKNVSHTYFMLSPVFFCFNFPGEHSDTVSATWCTMMQQECCGNKQNKAVMNDSSWPSWTLKHKTSMQNTVS